jgi:hypothetical protein
VVYDDVLRIGPGVTLMLEADDEIPGRQVGLVGVDEPGLVDGRDPVPGRPARHGEVVVGLEVVAEDIVRRGQRQAGVLLARAGVDGRCVQASAGGHRHRHSDDQSSARIHHPLSVRGEGSPFHPSKHTGTGRGS